MKIFFIYSLEDYVSVEKPLSSFSAISFGISFIATACKQAGYDVSIFVATSDRASISNIIESIKNEKPQVLAFTAVTSQYFLIKSIASIAKKIDSSVTNILGGHHATLNPEITIQETVFDAICIGEGDQAIVSFIDQLSRGESPEHINNLWIRNKISGIVDKSPQSAFIQDLDALPIIDRSLWEKWIDNKDRMHTVLIGRGCPNKCSYCSNHALCKTGTGKYVRFRSPENIIKELTLIVENYPKVSSIHLEVETLSVNLAYVFRLCSSLESFNASLAHPLSFGTNMSITKNIVENEDLLAAFKSANFDFFNVGLESGSIMIRNEVLRRPKYTNDDLVSFSRLVNKYDIQLNIFALIGIPGERLSDYNETVECIRQCNPGHVFLSIFYPYPGTDLYNSVKKQGLFAGTIVNPEMERLRATLDLPGFSKREINHEYLFFAYRVYKGKKSLLVIVAIILRTYFGMHPWLNKLYRIVVRHPVLRVLQKKVASMSK
jgi:anaerobic magnesium-protoporphyrin IX monomethyl ester cyclase